MYRCDWFIHSGKHVNTKPIAIYGKLCSYKRIRNYSRNWLAYAHECNYVDEFHKLCIVNTICIIHWNILRISYRTITTVRDHRRTPCPLTVKLRRHFANVSWATVYANVAWVYSLCERILGYILCERGLDSNLPIFHTYITCQMWYYQKLRDILFING